MERNDQNNRNGVGIFYGVIGVATLIVAIVGATFAWFSASVASEDDAITAQSQAVEGTLTITPVTNLKTGLVPVASDDSLFPNFIGVDSAKCVDLNDNDICSVYQFTITNGANVAQDIGVNLVPSSNTFTNLKYALFPSTSDFTMNTALKTGDLVKGSTTPIELITSQMLAAANDSSTGAVKSITYTLVLWIEEMDYDQTEDDSAKAFAAGINVGTGSYDATTGIYKGGITGVLSTDSTGA